MKKNIIKIGLLSILGFGAVVSMNSCRDAVDIVQELRDRKSVVQGKSVDLGGRRIIKKKIP